MSTGTEQRNNTRRLFHLDFVGRALLAATLAGFGCINLLVFLNLLSASNNSPTYLADIMSRIVGLIFVAFAVALTVVRLPPKSDSLGWTARFAAVLGTFMTMGLVILPLSDMPASVKLSGSLVAIAGTALSAYCLWWLGRSFSIDAQARRLVTGGPYAIVRHPLYVSEAIALIGLAVSNLSLWSVALVVANLLVQYWRILNEEKVLSEAFAEYSEYKRKVPRIIPRVYREM